MKNFLYQVLINYKRVIFRNKNFFFFALFLPSFFYVLFSKAMVGSLGMPASYIPTYQADELINMVVYSSVISSIIQVSNTLLDDREHHFTLFIELSPVSKIRYYGSMLAVFLPLNLLTIAVLGLIAIVVNQVHITATMWLSFILVMPLASLPLVLIGILISFAGKATTTNILNQIAMFFLAIAGGLWFPLQMMPNWLQSVGKLLPSYQISNLVTQLIHRQNSSFSSYLLTGSNSITGNIMGLLIWTALLLVLIRLVLYLLKKQEVQTV